MRDEIFLLGRILFALVFLRFGVLHLTQTDGSAQYAAYKSVPNARFWTETDPQTKQAEMAQFFKNISIAGGALILVAVSERAPYTITDGVF